MIDPQNQANKWVRNSYKDIIVANLKMSDFLRKLENAIQFGQPYLLQDVEEMTAQHLARLPALPPPQAL